MKQKILEALKNRYANLGFGNKAFDGVAGYLSETVTKEEDIETAVSGVEGLLKAFQADADKTRTEKSEAEKRLAALEAKAKEPGGAPDKDKDEPGTKKPAGGGAQDQVPAWAQAIIDSNKKLSDRLDKMDGERATAARRQQLSAITGKLPENLRKAYERTPLDSLTDEQFGSLVGEITKEVDGIVSEIQAKGAVFGRPGARAGKQKNDTLTKEQLEAVVKRGGAVASDRQPF